MAAVDCADSHSVHRQSDAMIRSDAPLRLTAIVRRCMVERGEIISCGDLMAEDQRVAMNSAEVVCLG